MRKHLTGGSLFKKVFLFTVPVMLSAMLQLLYNSADLAVVGQFAGEVAFAAVGATSSLFHTFTNTFMGLAIGVNILAAYYRGADDKENASRLAHTSIYTSVFFGLVMAVAGYFTLPTLLRWMGTPEGEIFDGALLYMRICFCGMPVSLLYNSGASLLKALGDTRRPFIYLTIAGAVNIVFNLFFVIVCDLSVVGVALATVISQALSATLVLIRLSRADTLFRLSFRKLVPDFGIVWRTIRIGIPAGLQTTVLSLSNVFFQSAVNGIGPAAISGAAAGGTIDSVAWAGVNSFQDAAVTFSAHYMGKKQPEKTKSTLLVIMLWTVATGLFIGLVCLLFGRPLLSIFIPGQEEAMAYGMERLISTLPYYFIAGIMIVTAGTARGMGQATLPTVYSILAACGGRLLWLYFVFPLNPTLSLLYISYPLSWGLAALLDLSLFFRMHRKIKKNGELKI